MRLGPARLELVEETLVGRDRVIAVHAVFDQQLPIRFHAVGLRAVRNLELFAAKFAHQVEMFAGVAEIAHDAFDGRVVAD